MVDTIGIIAYDPHIEGHIIYPYHTVKSREMDLSKSVN